MRKRDPKMTAFLEENLLSFEDLKNLSVKQLARTLKGDPYSRSSTWIKNWFAGFKNTHSK